MNSTPNNHFRSQRGSRPTRDGVHSSRTGNNGRASNGRGSFDTGSLDTGSTSADGTGVGRTGADHTEAGRTGAGRIDEPSIDPNSYIRPGHLGSKSPTPEVRSGDHLSFNRISPNQNALNQNAANQGGPQKVHNNRNASASQPNATQANPFSTSRPSWEQATTPASTHLHAQQVGLSTPTDSTPADSSPSDSSPQEPFQNGSPLGQRILASIFAPLLGLKERVNQSKAIDNSFIQRIDKYLLSLFNSTRISRPLDSLSRQIHAIVAQRDNELKEESPLNGSSLNKTSRNETSTRQDDQRTNVEHRPVSTVTRLGFVSLAFLVLVGGWFWVGDPAANATDASDLGRLSGAANALGRFAVINPDNIDESTLALAENDSAGSDNTIKPLAAISAAMGQEPANNGATVGDSLSGSALSGLAQLANAANQGDPPASDDGPKTIAQLSVAQRATSTPSPAPTATITPTPTEEEIPVDVPQLRLIPMLPFPSALPTETATATPTITPTPLPIEPGALWSTFIPNPSETDRFWLERPFLPTERNQLASTNYQFGSNAYGRYRMHHGLDMSNSIGTSVLATVDGEVIHAGVDDPVLLAPFTNFYGNTVVIRLDRKLTIAGSEVDVFVLFGHLNSVNVSVGQRVSPQDKVGEVGMTGIAIGPHLHVEVRVGSNTYDKTVNPYLWMRPKDNRGAVAVRLLTADGRTWPGGRVSLIGQGGTRFSRTIEIYLDDEPLGPDPRFGENGAMGSVPPGNYLLAGSVNGEKFRKEIVVNAGETTFAEIRTQQ